MAGDKLKGEFRKKDKAFDYGFIFESGFEITHVAKKYFDIIDAPVKKVRKRIPKN